MNEICMSNKSGFKNQAYYEVPIYYALTNKNQELMNIIIEHLSQKEIIESLSYQRKNKESVYACIFNKLSQNKPIDGQLDEILPEFIKNFINELNPFVILKQQYFRFNSLSFRFKDKELIHPLIYQIQDLSNEVSEFMKAFDIINAKSITTGFNFIDQLFISGNIRCMAHQYMHLAIEKYLKNKQNLKKIERIINSDFPEVKARNYSQRIAKFLENKFGIKIKVDAQKQRNKSKFVFKCKQINDDYLKSSQKCLDQKFENYKKKLKQDKVPECKLDSTHNFEKNCVVVKDEDTGRYFDAFRSKIDIKKTYYGLNSYYIMQLLKDNSKDLYVLWTHWGRSGDDGEFQRTPFKKYEEAIKEYCKLFKKKFGYKWEEAHLFCDSIRNPFIQPGLGIELTYNDIIEELDYSVKMINDTRLEEFFKCLLNSEAILEEAEEDYFNYYTLLLTPFSFEAIEKGLKILNKIRIKAEECEKFKDKSEFDDYQIRMEQISDLNNEYLREVPTIHHEKINIVDSDYRINEELKKINRLFYSSSVIRMSLAAYLNQDKTNPIDYVVGVLPPKFRILEESTDEHKLLLRMLNYNDKSMVCKCILDIDDSDHSAKEENEFNKIENHMMLFLNVEDSSILNILIDGANVHTYQMKSDYEDCKLGDHYQFKDYCEVSEGRKYSYSVICEVALGAMINVNPVSDDKLRPHNEVDSYRIMSESGPNWDEFVTFNNVVFPIGKKCTYDPPFCREVCHYKFDNYNTLAKFISGKIEESKMHQNNGIWRLGKKQEDVSDQEMDEEENDVDEEENDVDEEDMDEDENSQKEENNDEEENEDEENEENEKGEEVEEGEEDEDEEMSSEKSDSKSKGPQKPILIDRVKNSKAKISFPMYENEITAVMPKTFKSKDSIDYQSSETLYIVLNRNQFRIRYIAFLEEFNKEDFQNEGEEEEKNEEVEEEDDY